MKNETLGYVATAVLCAGWLLVPGWSQTRGRDFNIDFQGGADRCSDLKVRSSGQVARAADSFSLQKSEAPTLEVDAPEHGIIRARGWNRNEYSVEACKIAVADDQATAGQLLQGISVTRSAGRFSSSGPSSDAGRWEVYFIVHAPKDASLDLETKNGPIDVGGVSGTLKARATNGPIAIRNSSGAVEARTNNGPISFSGGGGDVRLNARNGPISLKLAGEVWNGARLEAATVNGPLSLALPDRFRSAVRVEASGHGFINCRAGGCVGASTDSGPNRRTMQFNGSGDTVRVSTVNGPISVSGGKATRVL
jgi:hypothetical protein